MEIRYVYIIIALFLVGCSSEEELPTSSTDFHYDYFPLSVGNTRIYQVDSTIFDPQGTGTAVTTSSGQLKEIIADTFKDQSGDLAYRVEVYYRRYDTLPWSFFRNKLVVRRTSQLEVLDNNQRFIKLIFPPEEGITWDGNAFIDDQLLIEIAGEPIQVFKNWSYAVTAITPEETINGKSYSNVLNVQLANDENLIELRRGTEKYAKGIGLVYRSLQILDTQQLEPSLTWDEKAERGFITTLCLIDHF